MTFGSKKNKFNNHGKLSFQRKLRAVVLRTSLISKTFTIIILYLFFFTNHLNFIKNFFVHNFNEITADSGFRLKTVIIKGNAHITSKEIISILNADVGTPLFSISLKNTHDQLKKNHWIEHISVSRKLPDAIIIHISERKPIAIWQNQKKLSLIDKEGNIMEELDKNIPKDLIQVVGSDANLYAEQLIKTLDLYPRIKETVTSAIRYGERRWNIVLNDNITVKMPEKGIEKALDYLSKLNSQNKLFNQNYKALDLRDGTKYYIEKIEN
ncbi:MAG: cell division protein FtsQ [Pseudomonadota bacterium]|jgi:cell division protein FtsQ